MKMQLLIVVAALAVLVNAAALSDSEKWAEFKVKFSKNYSIVESRLRFQTFQRNLRKIEEHNDKYDKGEVTYYLAVTKFADWTDDEFDAMLKTQASTKPKITASKKFTTDPNYSRPESVDWRNTAVLEVKDQQQCGSCWAFSITGSIEGQLAIHKNQTIPLSEQELVDCVLENMGCSGGDFENAFEYIEKNGLSSEEQYPYIAKNDVCKKIEVKTLQTISGYVELEETESALANAVASIGPISVAVEANRDWNLYGGGIFTGKCGFMTNHGVLAVGYGDGYWIVKNSWGSAWGEDGFIRIVRGKNLCGINLNAQYPEL